MKTQWQASDASNEIKMRSNIIEFRDVRGDWHDFQIIATPSRIIFGVACNAGFIESGYLEREPGESLDDSLYETIQDIESYYSYGPEFTSRIVVNERM